MKKRTEDNYISTEVLAAFLEGNATAQESQEILDSLVVDADLRELMHISQSVDAELGKMIYDEVELIPMTAMAATCHEDNYCCLECEKYILKRLKVDFNEEQLLKNAIQNGWLKDDGTALYNIGRHLESCGLVVSRQYKATILDIITALNNNEQVIVAVDGGELLGDRIDEVAEDIFLTEHPDHTVVVIACDADANTITIYDPNSPNEQDTYRLSHFEDAWQDSKNYLVTINFPTMKTYTPKPIDLSDIELSNDLNDLREAIAENAHDVWAVERQAQGWTYGPTRDDARKQTPCMVAYSQLPDSEKIFDRDMAMQTLKLVKKLGYDIIKREETALYKELLKRIRGAKLDIQCPECARNGHHTPVSRHDIFCSTCGIKLDIDWSLYEK